MVLIIFRLVMIIFILTNGFRPLAGIMVLIFIPRNDEQIRALFEVSVPLRGLWFLSWESGCTLAAQPPGRFRPLTGIMVLITMTAREEVKKELERFPSPCGDYGSYRESYEVRCLDI